MWPKQPPRSQRAKNEHVATLLLSIGIVTAAISGMVLLALRRDVAICNSLIGQLAQAVSERSANSCTTVAAGHGLAVIGLVGGLIGACCGLFLRLRESLQ